MMKTLLVTVLAIVFSASVNAQSDEFEELTLNGMASFEQLRQEYYIGALYLESPANDPAAIYVQDGKKRMEIRVTTEKWSPRRFAQFWNQTILINNDSSAQQLYADQILSFVNLPKQDLLAGDRITIDSGPDIGTVVALNGKKMFGTSDPLFFDVLVSSWIGLRPPSTEFKRDILNLRTNQAGTDLLVRYESLGPTDARSKAVVSWGVAGAAAVAVVEKSSSSSKDFTPPSQNTRSTAKSSAESTHSTPPKSSSELVTAGSNNKPEMSIEKPVLTTAGVAGGAAAAAKAGNNSSSAAAVAEAAAPAKAVEPAPAPKVDVEKMRSAYRSRMIRVTYLNVEYPRRAVDRGHEGTVVLKITLDRKGKLQKIDEVQSSGHKRLDDAAREAVEKTAPYPKVQAEIPGDDFSFEIPFVFKL